MRASATLSLLLGAVLLNAPSLAQRGHREPPVVFQDESKMPAATGHMDPKLLMQQANELQQLSNGIPADIDNLSKGVISKDLHDRLKRIEKLAKTLRSEVQ